MIAIPGFVNVWKNKEELEARREEGRALARKHFHDDEFEKWQNRLLWCAQGLSEEKWEYLQGLSRPRLVEVVNYMIMVGAPFDKPYTSDMGE